MIREWGRIFVITFAGSHSILSEIGARRTPGSADTEKLGETWRNLAKPGETWRNPAKPGGTWRNLAKSLCTRTVQS